MTIPWRCVCSALSLLCPVWSLGAGGEPLTGDMGPAGPSVGVGLFCLFPSVTLKRVKKLCAGKSWRARVDDRTIVSVTH